MVIHRGFGILLGAAFLLMGVWGMLAWFRNKDPGSGFWRLLAGCQVGIGVQALIALVLFFLTAPEDRPNPLHYLYGAFPVVALVFAHRFSVKLKGIEWVAFAIAGLFIFGLQVRGFMTGA
ncbi:MAG: hypothetical protein ABIS18_01495 [Actinomycetota bacterium]